MYNKRGDNMTQREIKYSCYRETLENSLVSVEMILNHLQRIESQKEIFDETLLNHDQMKTILDLELALANLCILLRKMAENHFLTLPQDLRRDINSFIHSNRFEYNHEVIVYSQKGKEEVDLNQILSFCHSLLSTDNVLV